MPASFASATCVFCFSVALLTSNRMSGRLTTTPRAVFVIWATEESAPSSCPARSSRSLTRRSFSLFSWAFFASRPAATVATSAVVRSASALAALA